MGLLGLELGVKLVLKVVERDHLGGLSFHLVTEFSLRIQ